MKGKPDGNLEIEVKFFIADELAIRNTILGLGATSKGRFFETNVRYEDIKGSLSARGCLLRLRQDDQSRLTVKTKIDNPDKEFKVLRELEVVVDDFATMDQILEVLGFHQAQIYEKSRETFLFNQVVLCLDELPFGNFLEIEGSQTEIITAAEALGFHWKQRILSNYLEIFEYLRQKEMLEFKDVTFDNFRNHPVEFEFYRTYFEGRINL